MRRCVTSSETQRNSPQSRWLLFVVVLFALGSAVCSLQSSWAQPHQDDLRVTVPDPTATLTPGPTSTPTDTAAPGVTRVLLQDAPDGYDGTIDTTIDSYKPYVPDTLDGGLDLKGGEGKSILIRFDLAGQVPQGATIVDAELVFFVQAASGSTLRTVDVAAYRVLRDWQEENVSWSYYNTTLQSRWASEGCNGVDVDRVGVADDTETWEYRDVFKGFDVTDSINYWLDHPDENYGWLIKGVSSSTGTFSMPSSRSSSIENRPVLRIDYSMGGITPTTTPTVGPSLTPSLTETPGVTETPSASETPSATSTPVVVTMAAEADTYLDNWEPDDGHGGLGYMRCKASDVRKPIVQFDLATLDMPGYDVEVSSAELTLTTGSGAPSQAMDVTAFRLLTCWDETTATWNHPGVGDGWDQAGASGQGDVDTMGSSPVTVSQANTEYVWDVTDAVQAMLDEGNCGLVLVGPSGGYAEVTFMSSEAGYGQPQLQVSYTASLQVTPTPSATQAPSATPTLEGKRLVAIVYHDVDRDGFRDSGEVGIQGATIELIDSGTQAVVTTATTDADGQAEFAGLTETTYRVREIDPPGYSSTTADEQGVQMLGPVNYVYFGDFRECAIALPCLFKTD